MYSDSAWPEAAGVDAFIEERRRPQRVTVAVYGFLTAALFTILSGTLYPLAGTVGSGFVLTVPYWLVLAVVAPAAGWCVVVAVAGWRGRRWALVPARLTAAGLLLACGGFAALANPEATSMSAFGFGYTFIVLMAQLSGVVCLVCLAGKAVAQYFHPPSQPSPLANRSGPPMTGNEADWAPPQQRGQPFQPGTQHGPPPPGYQPPPPPYQ